MDLVLVVRKGQQPGRVFGVADGAHKTIGRAPECDIRLPDQGVSRRHCTVENVGGRLEVVDLRSANGTYINGEPIERGSLGPGDELALGPAVLECRPRAPRQVPAVASEATLAFQEGGATVVRKVVDTRFPAIEVVEAAEPGDLENLLRAQKNLATAYSISKLLATARHLEGVFESVIDSIFAAINADRAALLLQGGANGSDELRVVAARARSLDQPVEEITVSRTVVRDVLEHGVSSLSRDATADARYRSGESIIQQKIRSVICAPIATDDSILGVLYADSRSLTGAFSESDLELLALIGNQAGVAIHRAQLIARFERFFFDTIRAIVAAIDAKDGYTHHHSARVAAFATRIAAELGLAPEEIEAVELAGLLHDVGKIGMPESILNKQGPLTDAEFEEVKKHPLHGVAILSHIKSPRMEAILPGVRHHHEKWDGSGYPDGLKGDEIPLLGRVLAVADVLDALSSDRAYRQRLSFDEIVGMIRKEAGVHFDPAVVDAVASLHARGELDVPAEWHGPHAPLEPAPARES
jgi:putative nucleotidyltransferase with HDIG domain